MQRSEREITYKPSANGESGCKAEMLRLGQAGAHQPISWGLVGLCYSVCITAQLCENICFPHFAIRTTCKHAGRNVCTEECGEALDFEKI